jgi:hypothetical protein
MKRTYWCASAGSSGALALCVLGLSGTAWAQAPAAATEGTLEEITVTARRYAENLQDTPIAVSVFTGDALEERQIFESDRLTQLVPNLQFGTNAPLAGNNSSSQVFVRGIGQTDPTSTVDPGVGLYLDDVSSARDRCRMTCATSATYRCCADRRHLVRSQHDRRRDPAVDHGSGRRNGGSLRGAGSDVSWTCSAPWTCP